MSALSFTVEGAPCGQNAAYRISKHGGMFASSRVTAWKRAVAWSAKAAMAGAPPFEGPVSVTFRFFFPTRRSDADGPIKNTLDAMEGAAYLRDSQVVELRAVKALDRERPRAEIEVKGVRHEAR